MEKETTDSAIWFAQKVTQHLVAARYVEQINSGFHMEQAHLFLTTLAEHLGYRLERTMPYAKPEAE